METTSAFDGLAHVATCKFQPEDRVIINHMYDNVEYRGRKGTVVKLPKMDGPGIIPVEVWVDQNPTWTLFKSTELELLQETAHDCLVWEASKSVANCIEAKGVGDLVYEVGEVLSTSDHLKHRTAYRLRLRVARVGHISFFEKDYDPTQFGKETAMLLAEIIDQGSRA